MRASAPNLFTDGEHGQGSVGTSGLAGGGQWQRDGSSEGRAAGPLPVWLRLGRGHRCHRRLQEEEGPVRWRLKDEQAAG